LLVGVELCASARAWIMAGVSYMSRNANHGLVMPPALHFAHEGRGIRLDVVITASLSEHGQLQTVVVNEMSWPLASIVHSAM